MCETARKMRREGGGGRESGREEEGKSLCVCVCVCVCVCACVWVQRRLDMHRHDVAIHCTYCTKHMEVASIQ